MENGGTSLSCARDKHSLPACGPINTMQVTPTLHDYFLRRLCVQGEKVDSCFWIFENRDARPIRGEVPAISSRGASLRRPSRQFAATAFQCVDGRKDELRKI